MTKIGIISDTHGEFLNPIREFLEECQEIWHAGDIGSLETYDEINRFRPTRAVTGNIDDARTRTEIPPIQIFEVEACKVLMTHIGGYPGRYAPGISALLQKERPDIFVCGHSHILKVMPDRKFKLIHFNPGAAGRKGFHQHITALRLNIHGKALSDLEVFDLPRK